MRPVSKYGLLSGSFDQRLAQEMLERAGKREFPLPLLGMRSTAATGRRLRMWLEQKGRLAIKSDSCGSRKGPPPSEGGP